MATFIQTLRFVLGKNFFQKMGILFLEGGSVLTNQTSPGVHIALGYKWLLYVSSHFICHVGLCRTFIIVLILLVGKNEVHRDEAT